MGQKLVPVADFLQFFLLNRANGTGSAGISLVRPGRCTMRKLQFFAAAAALVAMAVAPSMANARHYRHHHHHHHYSYWRLPYHISYLHNYGPGPVPGTFAFYDGPATVKCSQSASAYLGQDHRRHPCF